MNIPTDLGFWSVQLLNGLVLSVILMLITLGLTIIFGILLVVNFAHGSLYMLGGYVAVGTVALTGSYALALLAAPILIGATGALIERVLVRPMRSKPVILSLLLTFGLALILDEGARLAFGSQPMSVPVPAALDGVARIGSIVYPTYRLFVIAIGVLCALALYAFLEKTDLGTVLRAASSDPEMLQIMGVNTSLLFTLAFGLGCALTALSGVITAPLMTVHPSMGVSVIVDAFVVLVLGGLGSLRGTILAALLVGQVQTLGAVFISEFSLVIVFALMAVILLFRPRGLLNLGRLDDGH